MEPVNYKPGNVLITGGCGFIGSNFINYIFDVWPESSIINVDKLILNSDISNIDTVIHFAADCTSTRCYDDPVESIENNVIALIQFLGTVRSYGKIHRFLHISTDEVVYGDSKLSANEKGKKEDAIFLPGNPYAATKAACESYISMCCEKFGMPIIILRINNVYGPNQWNVKVVPRFIEVAKNKEKFMVQGSGKQLRSWLYVDDVAEGIRQVVERGQIYEVYNIGSDFEMNIIDLAYIIQKEVDRQLERDPSPVEFVSIPDRPYNDLRYLLDCSKIKSEIQWSQKVDIEEGIRETVKSALSLRKKNQKMVVAVYGGKGWIGQNFCKALCKKEISYTLAESKIGTDSYEQVLSELSKMHCTHVLCCTGRTHGGELNTIEYLEGGPERTFENIRDNLFSVIALAEMCHKLGLHFTYVGTGYLFSYDHEHAAGGDGFCDDDLPTFFGNSYSIVKGVTDRMIRQFQGGTKECLNARITLPLNFNLDEERNLLAKILKYRQILDVPVSITILDDCIPSLIDLMERRVSGNINLVNPEPISVLQILKLYEEIISSNSNRSYEVLDIKSEKHRELCATKGNCALSTSKLEKLCPEIPKSSESLWKGFTRMAINLTEKSNDRTDPVEIMRT
ncbi:unnamed protein product [Thelazia callipaeda]|uniref:NAD(P)-bd_dom domain-containing protein n=1 Tax=Thelazia callipaeda TaxID=103827 RepID=A0A0N5DBP6_THECL|nr:unnamed protein product [Thelazia callipaeda]